jgi:phage terminase large subunit GpA-like protein
VSAPRDLWRSIFDAIPPIPALKISEWAQRHRVLSPESSSEPGRFRCDRIPMQIEPMDSACDPDVQETVLWWAAQTAGKSEVLNNIVGFYMHADPSPQLMVQPTVDLAEEYSKDRIAGMIRDSPALRGIVRDPRSRDSGNTTLSKRYPGGSFVLVGANAPSGLAGRPRRVILKDEVDRYPLSAGTEGDPSALADKRAETFPNAVKVSTSTATIKGLSKIENLYEQSDQRKWFVRHGACEHEFVLMWADVKWIDGEPENAWIECPGCKARLTDGDRVAMVRGGRWKPTAPFRGIRGYWLNGLNILFGAQKGYRNRIHQFVGDFLKAKDGGAQTLRVWINTFLAETYEEDAEKIDADDILKRCEEYPVDGLPEGVLVLTAGVDVHRLRIEGEIKGWGMDEEAFGVRKFVLEGDTEKDEIWAELDKVLLLTFPREDGLELKIERTFIDMGHKDRRVLAFCQPRLSRGVYPCRGVNRIGLNPPPLLPAKPSRNNKARIPHWNVGVTVAKTAIYDRLLLPPGEARSMHFPIGEGYGADYFKQLTAEKRKRKFQFGRPYYIFEKENNAVRNEALDVTVYALAALNSLAPISWNKLAANLKKQAQATQRAKAAQMTAEEMKSPMNSGGAEAAKSSEHAAETPDVTAPPETKSAEMDTNGKITPSQKEPQSELTPTEPPAPKPHHRRASGFRPRGGFVGGWR